MRSAASVLAAGLLLSGACHIRQPPVRPEVPVAPAYAAEYADDVQPGRRATEIAWRDFFQDPRLEALIEVALERNRDLAVATAQIAEARGLLRIQEAELVPTVVGTGDATRTRSAGAGVGMPLAGSTTSNRYAIGVRLSTFELNFWGRLGNLAEAARAQFLATLQARRAFRLALVRAVASAYLTSLEASERIQLAEATVRSRQEGLRIAKVRLDAGITSALDFRQAESLLTQADNELAALRLASARADNTLTVLVGGPIATPIPPPLPLASQMGAVAIRAGLPSDLLVARPDVLAAEEQLRGAAASIAAARAAFLPTIALTGNLGFASTALSNLVGSDGSTWSVGPSITVPIFNRGALHGNLAAARAREDIAVASYQRTIQGAFQEVADALAARRYVAEQVAAQQRSLEAQRAIAELAEIRYREGVVRYLEVLDAQRNLFAVEQGLLQLRRLEAENLVALYVALGGGPADEP